MGKGSVVMSEPMTPPDPASYNPLVDPEALLVSAMMWSNDEETLQEIAEFLTPEDFYRVQYSVVFSAICSQISNSRPHDPASIRVELRAGGDDVGIPLSTVNSLITELTTIGANDLAVRAYADQVASESYRRQFGSMVEALRFAADTAPESQLFEIMIAHGKKQRRAWERYQSFSQRHSSSPDSPHT